MLTQPWGFRIQTVRLPTCVHHGDAETTLPQDHTRRYAGDIGALLDLHPGQGDLSLLSSAGENLLRGLTGVGG